MSHDKHQAFYDQLAAEWDLQFTAEDLERLSNLVECLDIKEGMNILDVGCGTGILFDLLRRKVGKSGTVTGVDFSIEMARKAHRNFPFDNVNVVDGDVTRLPLGDSIFDLAISFASFDNFSDQKQALHEIHRVLKNDSLFCVIDLESSKELHESHHLRGGVLEHDTLPSEEAMQRLLEETSFRKTKFQDHTGLYLACAVTQSQD